MLESPPRMGCTPEPVPPVRRQGTVWFAVKVLAWARFNEAMTFPEVGDIVSELSEFETDETEPVPPMQVPFCEKHPLVKLRPFANVEEAVDEVAIYVLAKNVF